MLKLLAAKDFKKVVRLYKKTGSPLFRDAILTFIIFYLDLILPRIYFKDWESIEDIRSNIIFIVLQFLENERFKKYSFKIKYPLHYFTNIVNNQIKKAISNEISNNGFMEYNICLDDLILGCSEYSENEEIILSNYIDNQIAKFKQYRPVNYFDEIFSPLILELVSSMKENPYFVSKPRPNYYSQKYRVPVTKVNFFSRFYKNEFIQFMKNENHKHLSL